MSLISVHTDVSSRARGLIFGLSLHLHLYSVYASSEGLVQTYLSLRYPLMDKQEGPTCYLSMGD